VDEVCSRNPQRRSNWVEPTCQPLVHVSHVAHVPIATRITEDERLRADLVFDKSKLNTERIRVVWLSPNDADGAGGFRYGNVRFAHTLLGNKKAYWVESMAYGIEACRILITDSDCSAVLDPYDPRIGDGPSWIDPNGQHFWNGKYCLEFMVEGDLPLSGVTAVDFVKHHEHRCNIDYKTCRYCGWSADKGAAAFLGTLASVKSSVRLPGLISQTKKGLAPSMGAYGAIGTISRRLQAVECPKFGTTTATDIEAGALARALLRALADAPLSDDRAALAAQFTSLDEADAAVMTVIATVLGLRNAAAIDNV
jgi:hypothetical protein